MHITYHETPVTRIFSTRTKISTQSSDIYEAEVGQVYECKQVFILAHANFSGIVWYHEVTSNLCAW